MLQLNQTLSLRVLSASFITSFVFKKAFDGASKSLISLKKFVSKRLHAKSFLIKWEKVQFSGEKCF